MSRSASHRRVLRLPSAAEVVALYKTNRINSMRIYFADRAALDALRGSGIVLILDTGNDVVPEFASNPSSAGLLPRRQHQVHRRRQRAHRHRGGVERPPGDEERARRPRRRGSIKVSTAVSIDTLDDKSFPPSDGVMRPIVEFLASNGGAPLLLNVYPYFAYRDNQGRSYLNYALFQPSPTTVTDPSNGLTYTNLFDAMSAPRWTRWLAAAAASTWWCRRADGTGATVDNARTYNQNLINHAAKGTPRKPGPMEVYVFAMSNENQKPGDPTEKKFGLFNPQDKTPVYPITFA
ncbi:hypothetical protein QOZ80_1AG0046230 [Eleusine coracana subsp. coracana]|nr:hypothetical protein QOZ80_1AG0046230 [Eleusine coracana subsp. coracana]